MADRLSRGKAGQFIMEQRESSKRWYARRDGIIRGPFTTVDVTRYILLGRISLDDDISEDQVTWQSVQTATFILPTELKQLSSWEDYQQLMLARLQVDERKGDRRVMETGSDGRPVLERRLSSDRRSEDSGLLLARYFFAASETVRRPKERPYRLGTLVLTIMLAVLVVAWLLPAIR